MRTYEALYIVRPDLKDDEIQTIAKDVETLVSNNGGSIVRSETWGKRRLAYEVQHFNEGCYVLLRFTGHAPFVAKLENHFRLTESILRYLVVLFDERTLALEAEQKRRNEEQLRASAARAAARATGDDDEDEVAVPVYSSEEEVEE
ncbi:MAG: 30S ribosomal protein S6 [Candidatus Hydrogenedentes bacterium]|nr:30S ribosomal protein S6 [Candidatus Hydrogenedentota bacterium]